MYSEDAMFEAMEDARYERECEWEAELRSYASEHGWGEIISNMNQDHWVEEVFNGALDYDQALANLEDLVKWLLTQPVRVGA